MFLVGQARSSVLVHCFLMQREKAWTIRAYPCTGFALFLQPMLPRNPAYSSIIERIQLEAATFIDIGCFIGHDLRRLVFDGAPADKLVACDIVNFWDVGFDFYRDRDSPFGKCVKHIVDDVLHPNKEEQSTSHQLVSEDTKLKLADLNGKMDIVNVGLILHHWDWNDQVRVCKNLVELSKGPGAIIVGCQIGSTGKNRMKPHCEECPYGTFETYWHNPETWTRMWDAIGQETGTSWETNAQMKTFEEVGWRASDWWYLGDCARVLQFIVKRLQQD